MQWTAIVVMGTILVLHVDDTEGEGEDIPTLSQTLDLYIESTLLHLHERNGAAGYQPSDKGR
jgi:hypothetical protein